MSRNWRRYISVTLEGGGSSLTFSDFKIRFRINHKELGFPQNAEVYIYNLAKETEEKVRKEYKTITIDAGYEDKHGVIFRGEVIQVRTGRESPTDTYMAVVAKDSEQAHNYSVTSTTVPAGSTYRDQVDKILEAMREFKVTAGQIDDLGSKKMPRSRVLHGMSRDLLRSIAFATGTSWHIMEGKLNIVKNDGHLSGGPIVYNSGTGLIGRPEQTIEGIHARFLLNGELKPLSRVKIDQGSINQAAFSPAYLAEVTNSQFRQGDGNNPAGNLSLADDGIYKILTVDHVGDSRGPPWYTDVICIKADGTIPIALAQRGIATYDLQTDGQAPASQLPGAIQGTPSGRAAGPV